MKVVYSHCFALCDILKREKIGEGKIRQTFDIGGGLCGKILKGTVPRLVSMIKYGVDDWNDQEFENYRWMMQRIPAEEHYLFGKIVEVVPSDQHGTILAAERIMNSNKTPAQSLLEEQTNDWQFWWRMDHLKQIFFDYAIPYFTINAHNVMVRHDSQRGTHPVIVDYKRVGVRFFPFQPWLVLPRYRNQKIERRFERLKAQYCLE